MRGKVQPEFFTDAAARITPAHAGKRLPVGIVGWDGLDHPRPCGEKFCAVSKPPRMAGSPPPMRGKVEAAVRDLSNDRITPAHAGKSYTFLGGSGGGGDHPRPCGEKSVAARMSARL